MPKNTKKRCVHTIGVVGNLKGLALRLFISLPCFKGIHEHSVVPNQVGNDDLAQPNILLKRPVLYMDFIK